SPGCRPSESVGDGPTSVCRTAPVRGESSSTVPSDLTVTKVPALSLPGAPVAPDAAEAYRPNGVTAVTTAQAAAVNATQAASVRMLRRGLDSAAVAECAVRVRAGTPSRSRHRVIAATLEPMLGLSHLWLSNTGPALRG